MIITIGPTVRVVWIICTMSDDFSATPLRGLSTGLPYTIAQGAPIKVLKPFLGHALYEPQPRGLSCQLQKPTWQVG